MTNPQSKRPAWWIVYAAFAVGLLLVNVLTHDWYPLPYVDETMLADPAINLITGHGFNSTIWFARPDTRCFGGNVPGYPAVLVPWLSAWGAGMLQVRSLNYVLATFIALLLPVALARNHVFRSRGWIALAIVFVLTGWPAAFVYRSGRSDSLGMALFAIGWVIWSLPPSRWRSAALFVLAALLPFTGLQYLWFLPVLLLALLAWVRPIPWREALLIGLGFGTGMGLLACWFAWVAGWDGILATIAAQKGTSLEEGYQALVSKGRAALRSLLRHPHHVCVSALGLALLLARPYRVKHGWAKSLGAIGFMVATVASLLVGGVYYPNYHWMATVPPSLFLLSQLERLASERRAWAALLAIPAAVVAFGLPVFLWGGWVADAPAHLARLEAKLQAVIRPGDRVLAGPEGYYALKRIGCTLYAEKSLNYLSVAERTQLTVLVLPKRDMEEERDWIRRNVGGPWVRAHDLPSPPWKSLPPLWLRVFNFWGYFGDELTVWRRPSDATGTASQAFAPAPVDDIGK